MTVTSCTSSAKTTLCPAAWIRAANRRLIMFSSMSSNCALRDSRLAQFFWHLPLAQIINISRDGLELGRVEHTAPAVHAAS